MREYSDSLFRKKLWKVHLIDSVLAVPFAEIEAFPFSKVHVPAAAASVENDRARKVQKDMSEAIVKRIALKKKRESWA